MRYRRGSVTLSETRDYPLLRHVLRSGAITADQLYAFLELDYCASSRKAFDNRVRRLVAHALLVQHDFPTLHRGSFYSISQAGASEMVSRGEYFSGSLPGGTAGGCVHHALELNEVHLALQRSGALMRWMPESDIRSRNEFTGISLGKDYDAGVTVRIDGNEYRFALEYERTPKAKYRYAKIRQRIEGETEFEHFLYLAPNRDLLAFLRAQFRDSKRAVHFGLYREFLVEGVRCPVQSNGVPISRSFAEVLICPTRTGSHRAKPAQAPLF